MTEIEYLLGEKDLLEGNLRASRLRCEQLEGKLKCVNNMLKQHGNRMENGVSINNPASDKTTNAQCSSNEQNYSVEEIAVGMVIAKAADDLGIKVEAERYIPIYNYMKKWLSSQKK